MGHFTTGEGKGWQLDTLRYSNETIHVDNNFKAEAFEKAIQQPKSDCQMIHPPTGSKKRETVAFSCALHVTAVDVSNCLSFNVVLNF